MTSHIGLTSAPAALNVAAIISTPKPPPAPSRPMPNFVGLLGSREPSAIQIHAKTGANTMMNSGCSDWK